MIENLKGLKGFSAWNVYNKVVFNLIFIREFNIDKNQFLQNVKKMIGENDIKEIRDGLPDLLTLASRVHKTSEECILNFKKKDRHERSKMLVEALTFANLDDEEVMRLIAVHCDENGMGYTKANVMNLDVGKLFNLMIETMLDCSEIECDLSLAGEISKDLNGRIDIKQEAAEILKNNSDLSVSELIAIGITNTLNNRKR